MADDFKKPTPGQPEYRSIGAAVGQFLSNAQHGAGWTAGALTVAGTAAKITGVFKGGDKPEKPNPKNQSFYGGNNRNKKPAKNAKKDDEKRERDEERGKTRDEEYEQANTERPPLSPQQ